MNGLVWAC